MKKIMNILVFGGAGYIGSHCVLELCNNGHHVTVYDNLSTGYISNLDKRVKFIKGDILDQKELDKAFRSNKYDCVFHFSALKSAELSSELPEDYSRVNITGTINILNGMVAHNVDKIIFSSTAAVYGEPKYLPIDEKHPLSPENYYGFTKMEAENLIIWYSKLKGIKYAILRYFNAVGYDSAGKIKGKERNPENLFPKVLEFATGVRKRFIVYGNDYPTKDGTCIRDYVHVTDLAEGHILALNKLGEKARNKENNGFVVNLGSGKGYSVFEVINAVSKVTGKKLYYKLGKRRKGDPSKVYASNTLAKKFLGWKPKHSDLFNEIQTMWKIYK